MKKLYVTSSGVLCRAKHKESFDTFDLGLNKHDYGCAVYKDKIKHKTEIELKDDTMQIVMILKDGKVYFDLDHRYC